MSSSNLPDTRKSRVFMGPQENRESLLAASLQIAQENNELTKSKARAAKKNGEKEAVIFMGPQENRESSLEKVSAGFKWTEVTEAEYMERVKEKALVRVKALLVRAEERGKAIVATAEAHATALVEKQQHAYNRIDQIRLEKENTLHEAENIKALAYDEGYNAGLHQAQVEFLEIKKEYAQAMGTTLLAIHEQCITIFNSWRQDLSELTIEAVEKSIGYFLDAGKRDILESLLEQSVNALLDKREYQIRVNPQDAAVIMELLETMHKNLAETRRWNLVSDEELETGSLIVESPSGLVKNTSGQRIDLVSDILQHLTLPLSDGDQLAYDNITQTLVDEAAQARIPVNGEEYIPDDRPRHTPETPIETPQEETQQAPLENSVQAETPVAPIAEEQISYQEHEDIHESIQEQPVENIIPEPMVEAMPEPVQAEEISYEQSAEFIPETVTEMEEIQQEADTAPEAVASSEVDDFIAQAFTEQAPVLSEEHVQDISNEASQMVDEELAFDPFESAQALVDNKEEQADDTASFEVVDTSSDDIEVFSPESTEQEPEAQPEIQAEAPLDNQANIDDLFEQMNTAEESQEQEKKKEKEAYTPELADELLSEMGF